ncbi:nuclear transport factor 2 family protein [Mucilaginibacter auburnensis]|uniref:Ketosteroid isomerase-like protein n=1 Tax=Mucilaginibacter auburnensis TaxID=1457233 RepID=A0A2H9VLP8_9SPHI|nr:nuclear transport factor 2 family protein [Mucilaginibacter auburnensis]PJJ79269.1 ketosteroid isomerase-like protein [Mucilaginibacter auburnensis]
MKTAKELLLAYLENIGNPDFQIELFADDAVFELPYLASIGLPARWEGREVLYQFLSNLPKTFPGFQFRNIRIHIDTPEQAFGEYEATAKIAANGKDYAQHYMGRVVAENGRIKLIREALNMVPVLRDIKGIPIN